MLFAQAISQDLFCNVPTNVSEKKLDASQAHWLWQSILDGNWYFSEYSENNNGKKQIVARFLDEKENKRKPFSQQEKYAVIYAAKGLTEKEIAYELSVHLSTVRTLLARARQKLGNIGRHSFRLLLTAIYRSQDLLK